MIDLYTWGTPNGRKVSILLEELGLAYDTHPINILEGEQFDAAFLKISPNNRIPAILDRDTGMTLMESGAIMIYLADKAGRFLPGKGPERLRVIEWLMWQMGGFGPMIGQAHHFLHFNRGKAPYAETRYGAEARRLYGVLDRRLQNRDYVADQYSIADIAIWPWASRHDWHEIDLGDFPHVRKWYRRIREREAVVRGYHVPAHAGEIPPG